MENKKSVSRDELKGILTDILRTNQDIFLEGKNNVFGTSVDGEVVESIIQRGYSHLLSNDVTFGPFLSGIPASIMHEFYEEKTLFQGVNGNFRLGLEYAEHSVPYFQAIPD